MKERKVLLAIGELEASVAIDPKLADAYLPLGLAYITVGRKSSAIAVFEKFLALAPNHKEAAKVREIVAHEKAAP